MRPCNRFGQLDRRAQVAASRRNVFGARQHAEAKKTIWPALARRSRRCSRSSPRVGCAIRPPSDWVNTPSRPGDYPLRATPIASCWLRPIRLCVARLSSGSAGRSSRKATSTRQPRRSATSWRPSRRPTLLLVGITRVAWRGSSSSSSRLAQEDLQAFPRHESAGARKADAQYVLALCLEGLNKHDEASKMLASLIKDNPQYTGLG